MVEAGEQLLASFSGTGRGVKAAFRSNADMACRRARAPSTRLPVKGEFVWASWLTEQQMATGVVFTYSRAYNRATRRTPSSVAVLNGGASACERYRAASLSSGFSR